MVEIFVALSLLTGLLWGASYTVDKFLISYYFEYGETLLATSGIVGILAACGIVVTGNFAIPSMRLIAILCGAGVIYSVALVTYFKAIEEGDITIVGPLMNSYTLVVVLIGYVYLGEVLSQQQYSAIFVLLAGITLLSYLNNSGGGAAIDRSIGWGLLAVLFFGLETVVLKFALETVTFWTAFFWSRLSVFVILSGYLFTNDAAVEEFQEIFTNPFSWKFFGVMVQELTNSFGIFIFTIALAFGPASIVTPLAQTSTFFVFIFTACLHMVGFEIEEKTEADKVTLKIVAAVLVFVGIVLAA